MADEPKEEELQQPPKSSRRHRTAYHREYKQYQRAVANCFKDLKIPPHIQAEVERRFLFRNKPDNVSKNDWQRRKKYHLDKETRLYYEKLYKERAEEEAMSAGLNYGMGRKGKGKQAAPLRLSLLIINDNGSFITRSVGYYK